jgi:hypothetical protein
MVFPEPDMIIYRALIKPMPCTTTTSVPALQKQLCLGRDWTREHLLSLYSPAPT